MNTPVKNMMSILFLVGMLCLSCASPKEEIVPTIDTLSIRGADISFIPEIRESGITTRSRNGVIEDMLTTLHDEGMNVARLRIWNNPSDGHSNIEEVTAFAKEIKALGIKVWITVHYSDWWADPGKQNKPKAWQNISFNSLKDSVYAFTAVIMQEIDPEIIQIGNEINNGFLWPDGHADKPQQMKDLLASGVKAVRDHNPNTQIMMHFAGHSGASSFLDSISDIDYDIIGLSYYPFWHGKSLQELETNLTSISNQLGKSIVVAETSYPFTFEWNDDTGNVIGLPEQILDDYPPTVSGQRDFLFKIRKIVSNTPKGIGFCYWAPEWVSFKGAQAKDGSAWENQALWGFDKKALSSISIFNP